MEHNCMLQSKVTDSRTYERGEVYTRRRRECLVCGNRITTCEVEIPDSSLGVPSIYSLRAKYKPDNKLIESIVHLLKNGVLGYAPVVELKFKKVEPEAE